MNKKTIILILRIICIIMHFGALSYCFDYLNMTRDGGIIIMIGLLLISVVIQIKKYVEAL